MVSIGPQNSGDVTAAGGFHGSPQASPDQTSLREGWHRMTLPTAEKETETNLNRGISSSVGTQWTLFGRKTQQSKVVYFTQATILYVLIITSLVNITLESKNLNLWSTLLASAIGYLLPSPQLKERTGTGSSVNGPPNNGRG